MAIGCWQAPSQLLDEAISFYVGELLVVTVRNSLIPIFPYYLMRIGTNKY
jgi:hypothetical protein